MNSKYRAQKLQGYVLEPLNDGYNKKWQSFFATNPTVFRLEQDERVFLGYRAGGDMDHYHNGEIDIWGSNFGMAILDNKGEKVINRLPLPIMKKLRKINLPQNKEEYKIYMEKYKDELVVYHDFKTFVDNNYLYVVFHEASLIKVYDCIVKMPVDSFIDKINKSIELSNHPVEDIIEQWKKIWWQEGNWEPCGVNGTNRIYGSYINKNDILFYQVGNQGLQMCHRPTPDIAVLNTNNDTFAKSTEDGLTTYGVLQTCIRPGYFDNSHVGNNGAPCLAKIGEADVLIDVTHGVHNYSYCNEGNDEWDMVYLPYFRIRDAHTGELLYYSEEPILDMDDMWKEYVEEGAWVSRLKHLRGVIFTGGQIPVEKDKITENDWFYFYNGVGDTAVAQGKLRIVDIVPIKVLTDIKNRERKKFIHTNKSNIEYKYNSKVSGWNWKIENDNISKTINIVRSLNVKNGIETAIRPINTVPGYFDADCIEFDGKSIKYNDELGYVMLYKGIKWEQKNGIKTSRVGFGVLVFDKECPERLLYRSTAPINNDIQILDDWKGAESINIPTDYLANAEDYIEVQVKYEIKRIYQLIQKGTGFRPQMIDWLKEKAAVNKKYNI